MELAPVAHTYNPSYSGCRNQEAPCLKPARGNNVKDPISKIARTKWTGGVSQVVERLCCK
jgi:hypothetical protein